VNRQHSLGRRTGRRDPVAAHCRRVPGGARGQRFRTDKPASAKLEFLGKSLFIPIFFITTGFPINPVTFVRGILDDFLLVAAIVGALLAGKGIAAWIAGRAFGYPRDEVLTIWSLTLPQVAATLAATLVAYQTRDVGGQRLLDDHVLNTVFVLMLATSILGPVLTERFAPRLARPAKTDRRAIDPAA
jgi:Kef-type K+ transport system membrane component KefB